MCLLGLLLPLATQAAISLGGTRLVFDGRYSEASLDVQNRSGEEVLLQAWLSEATESDTPSSDLPFVVTPPLSVLAPKSKQGLRLLYEGRGMPAGQESLLHLYVMQVPRQTAGEGLLNIAIRQRINVFFRPPGLPGDPALTPETLRWALTRDSAVAPQLQVDNPTAFHAALLDITLQESRQSSRLLSDYVLLPPGGRRVFSSELLDNLPCGVQPILRFKALTDYGGQRLYSAPLKTGEAFTATLSAESSSAQRTLNHE